MYNNPCTKTITKGYASKVVIIEKEQVERFSIINDEKISFVLKPANVGKGITRQPTSMFVNGTFVISEASNITRYTHTVQLPLYGNDTESKSFIKDLANKEVFAVLLHNGGIVEVFGFEFGLNLVDLTFDGNNNGAIGQLRSIEPEFAPPLQYVSNIEGREIIDFDVNFDELAKESAFTSFNYSYNNSYTS